LVKEPTGIWSKL